LNASHRIEPQLYADERKSDLRPFAKICGSSHAQNLARIETMIEGVQIYDGRRFPGGDIS